MTTFESDTSTTINVSGLGDIGPGARIMIVGGSGTTTMTAYVTDVDEDGTATIVEDCIAAAEVRLDPLFALPDLWDIRDLLRELPPAIMPVKKIGKELKGFPRQNLNRKLLHHISGMRGRALRRKLGRD